MSNALSFLCQISAIFLRYPDETLKQESSELAKIASVSGLIEGQKQALEKVCMFFEETAVLDAQSQYVQLFDMSPSLSLYLFQHVHGDSRMRGQAMVDLLEEYRAAGLDMQGNELPDFLPAYLEYASLCDPEKARELLTEIVDILAVLKDRLEARHSVYTNIFRILLDVPNRLPDRSVVQSHLRDTVILDDPALLDARYEEKPVTFENASLPTGCQTMCHANMGKSGGGNGR